MVLCEQLCSQLGSSHSSGTAVPVPSLRKPTWSPLGVTVPVAQLIPSPCLLVAKRFSTLIQGLDLVFLPCVELLLSLYFSCAEIENMQTGNNPTSLFHERPLLGVCCSITKDCTNGMMQKAYLFALEMTLMLS